MYNLEHIMDLKATQNYRNAIYFKQDFQNLLHLTLVWQMQMGTEKPYFTTQRERIKLGGLKFLVTKSVLNDVLLLHWLGKSLVISYTKKYH